MSETTPSHQDDQDRKIKDVISSVRDSASSPETLKKAQKFVIIPGRIYGEHGIHPGQPAGYFVRTEGTTDTLNMAEGSIESMLEDLLGSEATDFIAARNSPHSMLKQAEELRAKLDDPEVQQRIRRLHGERMKLRKELKGY